VFGDDDQFGCLNFLTPQGVVDAARLVQTGKVFRLDAKIGFANPPLFGRAAVTHILLARHLYELASGHPELEAITHNLSITTLRYVPPELRANLGNPQTEDYLNQLNQRLLAAIEKSGEAFISNAVLAGKYALRFCIVNFRASTGDIEAMPQLLVCLGRQAHAELRNGTPGVPGFSSGLGDIGPC
jgi:hypothetical protein